jgi:protein arginine N-methyltransferase 5
MQRWLGEPVKAVLLPTHVFTTNKKGYPVLPRAHQDLLNILFNMNVQVCVCVCVCLCMTL